jgi:hypothetical protein
MPTARQLGEVALGFTGYSGIVLVSILVQGPFSMDGSAAVAVLGACFLFGFSRLVFSAQASPLPFLVAALLAALWYPFLHAVVAASYDQSSVLMAFTSEITRSFLAPEALRPTVGIAAAAVAGIAVGRVIRRAIGLRAGAPSSPGSRVRDS